MKRSCAYWLATLVALAAFFATGGVATAQGGGNLLAATFHVSHYRPHVAYNGPVNSVAVDPGDANRAAAASETGGLFRTSDGGSSWSRDDELGSIHTNSVRYLPAGDGPPGAGCPCPLVTVGQDFETAGSPGAYIFTPASGGWHALHGIFPTNRSRCADPGNPYVAQHPSAYEIAVAPDTRKTYIATDCGLAIGTRARSFRSIPITSAGGSQVTSVVALGGSRLIVGSPTIGFWRSPDDGAHWFRETTGIGNAYPNIRGMHALGADPSNPSRAYAVNALKDLYETDDSGATWNQIAASRGAPTCGGITNVNARLATDPNLGQVVRLYFGNRCDTKVASVPVGMRPYQAIGPSSWTTLAVDHADTRDIAFRNNGVPYLISSDGGVHSSTDGQTFRFVGGPTHGFDADQTTEVTGQYVPHRGEPDLYFGTQHNSVWSLRGTEPLANSGGEGFYIDMPSAVADEAQDRMTHTICGGCPNRISDIHFGHETGWSESETATNPNGSPHTGGSPAMVSPGKWVESTDNFDGYTAGLSYTTNEGGRWRQIARIGAGPLDGRPKVAGPAADPTLTQPYTSGYDARGLNKVWLAQVSGFSGGSAGTVRYARMDACAPGASSPCEKVGLGVTPTAFAWYEVLAVDPADPARMIAPDVFHGDMRKSTDGGDHWTPIPGLTDLVTHDGAYRFAYGPIGNGRMAPIASTISICPYDDSRVLIGSQQGGAYLSLDGGQHFEQVDGSGEIVHATSIFWLAGCASAYVSTYGRGIYKIDMHVECASSICDIGRYVRQHLRVPPHERQLIYGIAVWDGYIRSIKRSGNRTRIVVTPGSIVKTYHRKLYGEYGKHVKIVRSTRLPLRTPKRFRQAMFFKERKPFRVVRARSFLRSHRVRRGKVGRGLRHAPAGQRGTIAIRNDRKLGSTAYSLVRPREAIAIRATPKAGVKGTLELLIDGRVVSKAPSGTKQLTFATKSALPEAQAVDAGSNVHGVELVAVRAGKRRVLAGANLIVPNSDREPGGVAAGR